MRGARRLLQSEKVARGTLRPCREREIVELVAPDALPQMPSWLTPEGEAEWADLLPRVAAMAAEVDSAALGTLANLQGALAMCWQAGETPPMSAIAEYRRLSELFGVAGARSRILAPKRTAEPNPFSKNGKR